jgi:hypothetical protein
MIAAACTLLNTYPNMIRLNVSGTSFTLEFLTINIARFSALNFDLWEICKNMQNHVVKSPVVEWYQLHVNKVRAAIP